MASQHKYFHPYIQYLDDLLVTVGMSSFWLASLHRPLRHHLTQRTQGPDVGWRGKIRIDGKMYTWMGRDQDSPSANITGLEITPTRTIYNVQVGPMNLVVTFLSPIEASSIYLSSSGRS